MDLLHSGDALCRQRARFTRTLRPKLLAMTLLTKTAHLPRPLLGGLIAGAIAILTVVGVVLLGVGTIPSITLAIAGFASVLMVPVLLPRKTLHSAAQQENAAVRSSPDR